MSVADILKTRVPAHLAANLSNQQIADLMYDADLDRRAALRRGDVEVAAILDAEVEALARCLS